MVEASYNKKILDRYLQSDLSTIRLNEIHYSKNANKISPNGLNDVLRDLYIHAKHLNHRGSGERYLDTKQLTNCYLKSNKAISKIWQCLFAEDLINQIEPLDDNVFDTDNHSKGNDLVANVVQNLKSNGYYQFDFQIPRQILDQLDVELSGFKLRYGDKATNLINELIPRTQALDSKEEIDSSLLYYNGHDLLSSPTVLKIATSSLFKKIARSYFGTSSYLLSPKGWITRWEQDLDLIKMDMASQLYHFDYDSFNAIKFFVYMSDVDDSNGCHQVISGSHQPYDDQSIISEFNSRFRVSELTIDKYFSSADKVNIMGEKGTLFVTTPLALHRGKPLEKNQLREIISFEFVDNLYLFGNESRVVCTI